MANFGTCWYVASADISSPYRAFSKEKIYAKVGVKVGLQSVNITLRANKAMYKGDALLLARLDDINYNERFNWIGRKYKLRNYNMMYILKHALNFLSNSYLFPFSNTCLT